MIKINSLYEKEVISIIDGSKIGEIYDLEIDEDTGKIETLIISGKFRFFGFFGRRGGITIPWESVKVIGEETILADAEFKSNNKKSGIIKSFLN